VDQRADIFALGLILYELFTRAIPQGVGYRRIADVAPDYSYLDDLVDGMIQQNPERRYATIEDVKKSLIGHKNAFVSLQKLNEAKSQVVSVATPPDFEPITIVGLDYANGRLELKLSGQVPSGWAEEFRNPHGGHSAIMGYGPERFDVRGRSAVIDARENEKLIQDLVNHAKSYVHAANEGYKVKQSEAMQREERRQRAALEKEVADAELRNNILKNVKL
jgi:hypothetical protein